MHPNTNWLWCRVSKTLPQARVEAAAATVTTQMLLMSQTGLENKHIVVVFNKKYDIKKLSIL